MKSKLPKTIPVLVALLFVPAAPALAYYDPGAQRWINRDPLGEKGFESLRAGSGSIIAGDQNRYRLVGNNPICLMDYLGLDNPGCDPPATSLPGCLPGRTTCYLRCCAQHDLCYFASGCKSKSWLQTTGLGLLLSPCARCNAGVAACFANCALGGDAPDSKNYFCPNGPSAGTFWDNWYTMPASCWENGNRPPKPDGYP
jgi:RHS repeat-associated protein